MAGILELKKDCVGVLSNMMGSKPGVDGCKKLFGRWNHALTRPNGGCS